PLRARRPVPPRRRLRRQPDRLRRRTCHETHPARAGGIRTSPPRPLPGAGRGSLGRAGRRDPAPSAALIPPPRAGEGVGGRGPSPPPRAGEGVGGSLRGGGYLPSSVCTPRR